MYFLRLAKLKPAVDEVAAQSWDGFNIAGEQAHRVQRVLDVRQGELCWVTGTIYMDMPLKPNVLDDVAKDHFSSAPPPRRTYIDPSNPSLTQTMLEDQSGRLRLTGNVLRTTHLVTGVIIAALGTENANGEFEVIDIKVPDLPRQPSRWERDSNRTTKSQRMLNEGNDGGTSKKIAFVSGLYITGTSSDTLALELLTDYLLGCSGPSGGQDSPTSSSISRLIIAGNSIGDPNAASADSDSENDTPAKKQLPKKYGYDASAYNSSPTTQLDSFLSEILPSIPVTLMPGGSDPANFSLPQQGMHRAMLPRARAYCSNPHPGEGNAEHGWLDNVTNPWEGDVEGWRLWGCSGQNVDDVLRYLDFTDEDGNVDLEADEKESRLRIMEAMLRWRCAAPTAPDTLWCYPFQMDEPFVLQSCPHIFFAGNQPHFGTMVVERAANFCLNGTDAMEEGPSASVRLLLLPRFNETGELVIVDTETLEVEVVKFASFEGQDGGR
jgi:DNA polymerase delta subunit 2